MSATTANPDALELAEDAPGKPARLRWIGQPLVVVAMVAGVVAYVQLAHLDAVAARQLNLAALLQRTWEHIVLAAVSTAVVLVIALPLGVLLTRRRTRVAAPVIIALANVGQSAPAIGLLVLLALWLGLGFTTTIIALAAYAILPVLRNTITGIQGVDPNLVEAGRGMGMSATRVLLRIEVVLAVPVILAGVRVALVLLVGTATLATFIDGGGLGSLITTGITLQRTSVLVVGAVLVAALALFIDWLGRVVEEVARPKGM
ncbi:ABC transporter permease [Actinopolymorpha sp. NPDC004070]|uniref:ABC transporter permease n=1 Tax=Actinopolymorpha sp. NPDC004070 TaxID=3154548 RepID=UPI00339F75FE